MSKLNKVKSSFVRSLVLTPGDPDGVGPEVTIKALRELKSPPSMVLIGSPDPLLYWAKRLRLSKKLLVVDEHSLEIAHSDVRAIRILPAAQPPSRDLHIGGFQSGWSIAKAIDLIQGGVCSGLVTGPISKDHLNRGGYPYKGHTDFLADRSKSSVSMILGHSRFSVALVTTHLPLRLVASQLSIAAIETKIRHLAEFLRQKSSSSTKSIRIAVLGLNPHCGEGGLLGNEESELIHPAIIAVRRKLPKTIFIDGPFSSDTFFATLVKKNRYAFDGAVAMYHDQGLIPVKMQNFSETVNISWGLPFTRTSVDHGTAFDIAGKGTADATSMVQAILLASKLVKNLR